MSFMPTMISVHPAIIFNCVAVGKDRATVADTTKGFRRKERGSRYVCHRATHCSISRRTEALGSIGKNKNSIFFRQGIYRRVVRRLTV